MYVHIRQILHRFEWYLDGNYCACSETATQLKLRFIIQFSENTECCNSWRMFAVFFGLTQNTSGCRSQLILGSIVLGHKIIIWNFWHLFLSVEQMQPQSSNFGHKWTTGSFMPECGGCHNIIPVKKTAIHYDELSKWKSRNDISMTLCTTVCP